MITDTDSEDPTFWSRQLEILYSVLLSASLGVILGTSLPESDWARLRSANSVWAVLVLGVVAISIDAWYNFNQILRGAKFGKSQGLQIYFLAMSLVVATFLPFQFIVRHDLRATWARTATPITAFVVNLIALCVVQAFIALVAAIKLGQSSTTGRKVDIDASASTRRLFEPDQLRFLAGSRLAMSVGLMTWYLVQFTDSRDIVASVPLKPAIGLVIAWLGWRILEHTVGLRVVLPWWRAATLKRESDHPADPQDEIE